MNFKRILCMSLAALSIFASSSIVGAQEAEDIAAEEAVLSEDAELFAIKEVTSGAFTYECDTTKKTATIIAMTDAKWPSIPATVKSGNTECKVIAIADGVGNGIENLETLSFANATNLTSIGENCFSYCPKLHTITFNPKSKIQSIGNNTFYYCTSLETLINVDKQTSLEEVGSSVLGLTPYMEARTEKFVMLGNVLVKYNGTDKAVTIDSDVVAIADAFFGKDITSINLGKVETIGNNAFYGCKSLTSISIPSTCKKIGDMAFAGCTSLKTVEYAGGLTSIGFCSFANCSALTSFKNTATGASKLTDIGECAFWNDRKLHYLDIGTLENVNVGSFWNCFGETPAEIGDVYYYKLPETVKTIAEGGFGNLWFAYVAIPDDLDAVASTAFGSAGTVTYVVQKGTSIEDYFENSGYRWINYGDVTGDGKINSKDIKQVANYIAINIAAICAAGETPAKQDVLNYDGGVGVVADINGDGEITTEDLFEIFQSIREDYEASLSAE